MIEGHGNDVYRYGNKVHSDFSSNVAGRHVPDALLEFISSQLDAFATYPEPDSVSLRRCLSGKFSLSENQILVTNGSVEAFYTVAAVFRNCRSLIFTPSFAEYEDACRLHDHQLFFRANDTFSDGFAENPQLVWLGNPNNPDGRCCSSVVIREWLTQYPNTVFVIDEAYGDLCLDFESSVGLLAEFENLIVIQSMTKQYVLPGLRLGYLLTGKLLADRLRMFSVPWSVNAIAQRVGCFIFKNEDLFCVNKEDIIRKSKELQNRLAGLAGIEIISSSCNFFLMRFLFANASVLKEYLIQQHGILIRDASNFRGLDQHCVRLSVQTDTENDLLFQAIKNYSEQ